jgi:hypothetical protein
VFKSENFGEQWTEINEGLTNPFVNSLLNVNHLYLGLVAGTEGGVFNYDGISWYDYTDDLASTNVRCLAHSDNCWALFAGTAGGGVWRRDNPIGIIENKNESPLEIFPNPVDDFLEINLSGWQYQEFDFAIFSADGRQVGNYSNLKDNKLIDASMLSPGIYFALVVSEGKQIGRAKFVVAR